LNWLEYIKNDLSTPSGEEAGSETFNEILELCLSEPKKADISLLAARVATLSVLWDIGLDQVMVEEKLMAMLRQWKHRGDHYTVILSCLICTLTTGENIPYKVLEALLKSDICPIIHAEADKVLAVMSGEVVGDDSENGTDDDGEPSLGDYLIEFMEAWQACVVLLEEKQVEEQLKEMMSSFATILDHSSDLIRISAAHCLLSIADLSDRYDIDLSSEFVDIDKAMSRIVYDHSFEWTSSEGKSRKAFEQLAELIKSKETVVTVELLVVSGAPSRSTEVKGADFRHYAANANKKGHPVAGYADAALVEYFHSHLGHHFADLFSINNYHKYRSNSRAYEAMFSILSRHPASQSAALQIDSVRSYGAGSFTPGRNFIDRSYGSGKSRHRKVRVSDYL
jgi:PAS domain-containing protein